MKKILLLWLLATYLFAGTIEDAKKLFDNEEYKEALIIFNEYEDDPEAQYYLGKSYLYGLGAEKDEEKAFKFTTLSANGKSSAGINLLGVMYQYGNGVEKDEMEALMYYRQAVKLSNTLAMLNMGRLYENGTVVKKDINKAREWYKKAIESGNKKAIEHGDTKAYSYIGDIYKFNLKEYDKALEWYKKAIESGNKKAYSSTVIANIYQFNLKEYDKALEWYKKAINNGSNKKYIYEQIFYIHTNHYKFTKKFNKIELEKYESLLISVYRNEYESGNLESGCKLAYRYAYLNDFITKKDYRKVYDIATSIIKKDAPSLQNEFCYNALASLYLSGHVVAKDINKTIEIKKLIFTKIHNNKSSSISENIASIYLKSGDYKNAEKWYMTTYDLTGNKDYLAIVEKAKKTISKYNDKNLTKNSELFLVPNLSNVTFLDINKYTGRLGDKFVISDNQKNIKVHDKTFTLLKTIRGQSRQGKDGSSEAMTIDYKNNLLYHAFRYNQQSYINVFDLETGKVIKTITSTSVSSIKRLQVSEDGNFLVGSALLNVFVFNLRTNIWQIYSTENKYISTLHIEKIDNQYFLYLKDKYNQIDVISVGKKRYISTQKLDGYYTGFSENFICNYKDNVIELFDYDFILHYTINENLSFAEFYDKKNILLFNRNNIYTYNVENKIKTLLYSNHKIKIHKASYNRKENILSIETPKNLISYNIKTKKTKYAFQNNLKTVKILGLVDHDLHISENNNSLVFNLKYLELYANTNNFNEINDSTKYLKKLIEVNSNSLLLNKSHIDFYDKTTNELIATVKAGYKDNLSNYTLLGKEYILRRSPYDHGSYQIYTIKGKKLGVIETFNGKKFYYKNDKLFLYGSNNIIQIYDLKSLKPKNKEKNNLSWDEQSKLNIKLKVDYDCIQPLVSLYVKDNDWIIYNKEGLFASSKNGKNLIKYHFNQGPYKEAKIIENEQIFEKFYRPDLIKKILANEKVDEKIDIRSILLNVKPPEVTIVDKSLKGKKNLELRYKICDAGNGISNISMIRNGISANLYNTRGFTIETQTPSKDKCEVYKNIITLEPGKNTITVKAFDKEKIISNISNEITVEANYKIEKKPNLHFVSLAVSSYRDEALKLKYPVTDVIAVKKTIEKKSKNLFSNIYTYTLHDKNATKENLDELFSKISKKVAVNDVFVMYIAGHGVTSIKDGLFYFLPQDIIDTSVDGLAKNAISVNDLRDQLGKIAANKSLILIDTCDSGSFIEHASRGLEQRMAAERLAHATGRNYIVASSKNQAALEGYKNHGVFTYAVLEAFDKAYFGNSSTLMVSSLATFIQLEVPKITSAQFHYEQFPQKYLNGDDFPIGEK